ncbi:MAG: hypothetical protein ACP5RZ_05980 [Thermoplasmata archaeon]
MNRGYYNKITWRDWWHMFLHGRTHVEYGLLVIIILNSIMLIIEQNWVYDFVFLINVIMAVGAFVDIAAHLFYH